MSDGGLSETFKVTTGEEGETATVALRTKAYFFFAEDKYGEETRKNLVLLRQEKTLKPKVNFSISSTQKLELQENTGGGSNRQVTLVANDFSDEGDPVARTIAFKFKNLSVAETFINAFRAAQKELAGADKEGESMDENSSSGHTTPTPASSVSYSIDDPETWADLRKVLCRPTAWCNGTGSLFHPGEAKATDGNAIDNSVLRIDASDGSAYPKESFEQYYGPDSKEWNEARIKSLADISTKKVLCIGAGGLGCELLKNLALSGVKNIHVIDADVIDITNLNRQFLFRLKDVGNGKAQTAAAFVRRIVPDINITMDTCFIQKVKNPDKFYATFDLVVCGLDNISARTWMSNKLHDIVVFKPDPTNAGCSLDRSTVIPMIDGGTEGLKGQTHIVIPYWNLGFAQRARQLFPPTKTVQACTIATNPRKPEHCVLYAKKIMWNKMADAMVESGKWSEKRDPDTDSREDMEWIAKSAQKHADAHNLSAKIDVDYSMGVVKNIIPAVPCSNAMIAASSTVEAIKLLTMCGQTQDNYLLLNGSNFSNAIYESIGSGNEWMRTLPLKSIVITSESATVDRFAEEICNHRGLHEMLARYNVPYLTESVWEDDVEEARGENQEMVYCAITESGTDFESDVVECRIKAPKSTKVCDVLDAVYAAMPDDDTRKRCGHLCLAVAKKNGTILRVLLDGSETVAPKLPLPTGQYLLAFPRMRRATLGKRRGVKALYFGYKRVDLNDEAFSSKTLKCVGESLDSGTAHGAEVFVIDDRLADKRLCVVPVFVETTSGKKFADAAKEASKSAESDDLMDV
eukprot:g1537.t1